MGNSILLAHPNAGEFAAVLPLSHVNMSDNVCVIFMTERSDVSRAAIFKVSRKQVLDCAGLRKDLCCVSRTSESGMRVTRPITA